MPASPVYVSITDTRHELASSTRRPVRSYSRICACRRSRGNICGDLTTCRQVAFPGRARPCSGPHACSYESFFFVAADALTTIPNAAAIAIVTAVRAFCLFDMGVSFPVLLVNTDATLIARSRFIGVDQLTSLDATFRLAL